MSNIPFSNLILVFAAALFCLGLFACITRKNLILILIGIELMVNASLLNLVVFDQFFVDSVDGQMMSLFAMVLSAISVALGLAIIIRAYRYYNTIDPDQMRELKN